RPRRPNRRIVRNRPRRPAPILAPAAPARGMAGKERMKIVERPFSETDRSTLARAGVHPVLARLFAARRIRSAGELEYGPERLHAPSLMKGAEDAARLLADA